MRGAGQPDTLRGAFPLGAGAVLLPVREVLERTFRERLYPRRAAERIARQRVLAAMEYRRK